MRKILYENPGIGTFNLGDQIISESAKTQLNPLFMEDFVVEVSTRLPLNFYFGRRFKHFDVKLVPVSYTHLDVYKRQIPGFSYKIFRMTINYTPIQKYKLEWYT